MHSGDSSDLCTGLHNNVWSPSATDLKGTGIAHGLGKYPLFSIRSRPLQKSIKNDSRPDASLS